MDDIKIILAQLEAQAAVIADRENKKQREQRAAEEALEKRRAAQAKRNAEIERRKEHPIPADRRQRTLDSLKGLKKNKTDTI